MFLLVHSPEAYVGYTRISCGAHAISWKSCVDLTHVACPKYWTEVVDYVRERCRIFLKVFAGAN